MSAKTNRALEQNTAGTITPETVDPHFDPSGNQTQMEGFKTLHWNHREHLSHVEKTPQLHEYYIYDSAGQRVRKISEDTTAATSSATGATPGTSGSSTGPTHYTETLYLGGVEIHRKHRGSISDTPSRERHTLRISDDQNQICNREYAKPTTQEKPTPPPSGLAAGTQTRYQLENHLGSATLEVDQGGALITYEEYFPYGGTSFAAGRNAAEASLKCYRYSGKERDTVTGFYYYGMRYYAPWIGRWLSADPAGTVDGMNLYAMVGGNPVKFKDNGGMAREITAEVLNEFSEILLALEYSKNHIEGEIPHRSEEKPERKPKESQKQYEKKLINYYKGLAKAKQSPQSNAAEAQPSTSKQQQGNMITTLSSMNWNEIGNDTVALAYNKEKQTVYVAINTKTRTQHNPPSQPDSWTSEKKISEMDYSNYNELSTSSLIEFTRELFPEYIDSDEGIDAIHIESTLKPSATAESDKSTKSKKPQKPEYIAASNAASQHAEMVLLSYLQDQNEDLSKYVFGVSKEVCEKCNSELQTTPVTFDRPTGKNKVSNWKKPEQIKSKISKGIGY